MWPWMLILHGNLPIDMSSCQAWVWARRNEEGGDWSESIRAHACSLVSSPSSHVCLHKRGSGTFCDFSWSSRSKPNQVAKKSADSTMAYSFHTMRSFTPTFVLVNARPAYDRNGRDTNPKFTYVTSSHCYVIIYAQKTKKLCDSHQTLYLCTWKVGSGNEINMHTA